MTLIKAELILKKFHIFRYIHSLVLIVIALISFWDEKYPKAHILWISVQDYVCSVLKIMFVMRMSLYKDLTSKHPQMLKGSFCALGNVNGRFIIYCACSELINEIANRANGFTQKQIKNMILKVERLQ